MTSEAARITAIIKATVFPGVAGLPRSHTSVKDKSLKLSDFNNRNLHIVFPKSRSFSYFDKFLICIIWDFISTPPTSPKRWNSSLKTIHSSLSGLCPFPSYVSGREVSATFHLLGGTGLQQGYPDGPLIKTRWGHLKKRMRKMKSVHV